MFSVFFINDIGLHLDNSKLEDSLFPSYHSAMDGATQKREQAKRNATSFRLVFLQRWLSCRALIFRMWGSSVRSRLVPCGFVVNKNTVCVGTFGVLSFSPTFFTPTILPSVSIWLDQSCLKSCKNSNSNSF